MKSESTQLKYSSFNELFLNDGKIKKHVEVPGLMTKIRAEDIKNMESLLTMDIGTTLRLRNGSTHQLSQTDKDCALWTIHNIKQQYGIQT